MPRVVRRAEEIRSAVYYCSGDLNCEAIRNSLPSVYSHILFIALLFCTGPCRERVLLLTCKVTLVSVGLEDAEDMFLYVTSLETIPVDNFLNLGLVALR